MIRLKKGLASYYWERLIIALIGEQFPVDVVGAVVSIRFQEDIISLWNKTGNDAEIRHEIFLDLCSTLSSHQIQNLNIKNTTNQLEIIHHLRTLFSIKLAGTIPFKLKNAIYKI